MRQVVQGGGNMPAYGKNLSPYEVEAVVSYMVSLRPSGEASARDLDLPAVPPKQEAAGGHKPPRRLGEAVCSIDFPQICVPAVM